ncbi:unnamed protein product [Parnassius apollo]|uniref:(apollo) hypothetical protein n=1 Tax=Parnassius apollo TaxID=110799 RepID=A0A8S3WJ15_PARAO|nr:unnamed protein product [Parnassius apollo]
MHVKDSAWRRVVEHFNNKSIPNIQAAKTEWKKLRDNHRDALKRAKLGKNKLLPAQITTWKYAKAMQFLEPHMKYRITENIEIDVPTCSPKDSEEDNSASDTAENINTWGHVNKRQCIEKVNDSQQETDALESFFNCILKSTKTMPYWMQTQVKKKIFAVIIEAEEMLANQNYKNTVNDNVKILKDQFKSDHIPETKIKMEIFTEDNPDYE